MTVELLRVTAEPFRADSRDLNLIKWIVVHHSATASGNVEAFRREHIKRGYEDVAYNYIICNGRGGPDGEVQPGRPLEKVGAHAYGANRVSVGICLVGNFMETQPTARQWESLISLCRSLMARFGIPPSQVIGHKEVPAYFNQDYATACPGVNFPLNHLRRELAYGGPDYAGHWGEAVIRKALSWGLLHGYPDRTFRPDQGATRAELAAGLVNVYESLYKEITRLRQEIQQLKGGA